MAAPKWTEKENAINSHIFLSRRINQRHINLPRVSLGIPSNSGPRVILGVPE